MGASIVNIISGVGKEQMEFDCKQKPRAVIHYLHGAPGPNWRNCLRDSRSIGAVYRFYLYGASALAAAAISGSHLSPLARSFSLL
jgi:hypothetical protein